MVRWRISVPPPFIVGSPLRLHRRTPGPGGTAKVKERPIIFQGWKVRKILEWDFKRQGNMQTRRVMKPQPTTETMITATAAGGFDGFAPSYIGRGSGSLVPTGATWKCPYGDPLDQLWVRENWALDGVGNRVPLSEEAWWDGWPLERLRYIATDEAPHTSSKD